MSSLAKQLNIALFAYEAVLYESKDYMLLLALEDAVRAFNKA